MTGNLGGQAKVLGRGHWKDSRNVNVMVQPYRAVGGIVKVVNRGGNGELSKADRDAKAKSRRWLKRLII